MYKKILLAYDGSESGQQALLDCHEIAQWSQAELGERLDVSRQAVNAIETGKYDPSLPLAFKIARLFGMPIEEIFDDGFDGAQND